MDIRQQDFAGFPFVYVDLPSPEVAQKIIKRSILIGMFIEVFSEGANLEEVFENMQEEKLQPYLESESTFQIKVKDHLRKVSMDEKDQAISGLMTRYNFKGKVDLNKPERHFILYSGYELCGKGN